jgi:hypothetical protein
MNPLERKRLFPRSLLGASLLVGFVLTPHIARADLPRPPGWEPTCTAEKELKKGGGPCEEARGYQDPDPRQEAFAAKGYSRRCTEGGAGSYVAVWCKSAPDGAVPAATNTPNPPPPVAPAADNRRGSGLCSVGVIGQDKPADRNWAVAAIVMGLGVASRFGRSRKARRRSPTP